MPMTPAEQTSAVAVLQRAFGPRCRVVGPLRPANRAEQMRRLAVVELTTTIPGHCQVEITGDGRVVRAWVHGKKVSAAGFWRRFVATRRTAASATTTRPVQKARPRTPGRRRRIAASARAAPREGPEPPPTPTASSCCERNAGMVEALVNEVRALREELHGPTTAGQRRAPPAPSKAPRQRPAAPSTVVPNDLDRARARAALKRNGWKRVD